MRDADSTSIDSGYMVITSLPSCLSVGRGPSHGVSPVDSAAASMVSGRRSLGTLEIGGSNFPFATRDLWPRKKDLTAAFIIFRLGFLGAVDSLHSPFATRARGSSKRKRGTSKE